MSNERHREGESPANYDVPPSLVGVRHILDAQIEMWVGSQAHSVAANFARSGAVAALKTLRIRLFPPTAAPNFDTDLISRPPAKEPT